MTEVRENSSNEREAAGNSGTGQGGEEKTPLKNTEETTEPEKLIRGITDDCGNFPVFAR